MNVSVLHAKLLSERVRRLAERGASKRAGMLQTCNAQMAVPSIERWGRSSPQVVWERERSPSAPAGHQRQARNFHGRPRNVSRNCTPKNGNVSGVNEDAVGFSQQRNRQYTCICVENMSQKRVSGPAASVYELWFIRTGLSLFPIQNSDRSRPARFHRHR